MASMQLISLRGCPRLTPLPVELKREIMSYLSLEDMVNARSTCKDLAQIGLDFLCPTLRVFRLRKSIDRIREIASRDDLRYGVRKLILYKDIATPEELIMEREPPFYASSSKRDWWKKLHKTWQDMREYQHDDKDMLMLSRLLPRFPRLKYLEIRSMYGYNRFGVAGTEAEQMLERMNLLQWGAYEFLFWSDQRFHFVAGVRISNTFDHVSLTSWDYTWLEFVEPIYLRSSLRKLDIEFTRNPSRGKLTRLIELENLEELSIRFDPRVGRKTWINFQIPARVWKLSLSKAMIPQGWQPPKNVQDLSLHQLTYVSHNSEDHLEFLVNLDVVVFTFDGLMVDYESRHTLAGLYSYDELSGSDDSIAQVLGNLCSRGLFDQNERSVLLQGVFDDLSTRVRESRAAIALMLPEALLAKYQQRVYG